MPGDPFTFPMASPPPIEKDESHQLELEDEQRPAQDYEECDRRCPEDKDSPQVVEAIGGMEAALLARGRVEPAVVTDEPEKGDPTATTTAVAMYQKVRDRLPTRPEPSLTWVNQPSAQGVPPPGGRC